MVSRRDGADLDLHRPRPAGHRHDRRPHHAADPDHDRDVEQPGGTYPINISGGTAANYTITDVPGTLTVVTSVRGTTTTLTSSNPISVLGQPVTFTATVTAASPVGRHADRHGRVLRGQRAAGASRR